MGLSSSASPLIRGDLYKIAKASDYDKLGLERWNFIDL